MRLKIISGGQTGVDETALAVARELGFPTGGYAPKDYMTEVGPNELALKAYGLVAIDGGYAARTELNVSSSRFTVWFGQKHTPGGRATLKSCISNNRCFFVNLEGQDLLDIIRTEQGLLEVRNPKQQLIVHIAGNRASKDPYGDAVKACRESLAYALGALKEEK